MHCNAGLMVFCLWFISVKMNGIVTLSERPGTVYGKAQEGYHELMLQNYKSQSEDQLHSARDSSTVSNIVNRFMQSYYPWKFYFIRGSSCAQGVHLRYLITDK